MPTVLATHTVKDVVHWLKSKKREEVYGPLGMTNIRTFVNPQQPGRTALVADIADLDRVMAFNQTPAAAEAMAHDGVLPETIEFFILS